MVRMRVMTCVLAMSPATAPATELAMNPMMKLKLVMVAMVATARVLATRAAVGHMPTMAVVMRMLLTALARVLAVVMATAMVLAQVMCAPAMQKTAPSMRPPRTRRC